MTLVICFICFYFSRVCLVKILRSRPFRHFHFISERRRWRPRFYFFFHRDLVEREGSLTLFFACLTGSGTRADENSTDECFSPVIILYFVRWTSRQSRVAPRVNQIFILPGDPEKGRSARNVAGTSKFISIASSSPWLFTLVVSLNLFSTTGKIKGFWKKLEDKHCHGTDKAMPFFCSLATPAADNLFSPFLPRRLPRFLFLLLLLHPAVTGWKILRKIRGAYRGIIII